MFRNHLFAFLGSTLLLIPLVVADAQLDSENPLLAYLTNPDARGAVASLPFVIVVVSICCCLYCCAGNYPQNGYVRHSHPTMVVNDHSRSRYDYDYNDAQQSISTPTLNYGSMNPTRNDYDSNPTPNAGYGNPTRNDYDSDDTFYP